MTRGQVRAVGLAAIMVVSMVAMGAVFAGGAVAQDAGEDEVVVLDESGDQIDDSPFGDIQSAVDNTTGGYTVVIGDGTYEEDVTVDVEQVTLRSADGATPTVKGIVTLAATGATIDGLTVDGGTADGAPIDVQTGDVTVSNNTVVGGAAAGGISTWGGPGPVFGDVSVRDNTVESGSIGLVVDSQSTDLEVKNNTISDTTAEGVWLSDFTDGADISEADITVEANDIENASLADVKVEQSAPGTLNSDSEFESPSAAAESFLATSDAKTVTLWNGLTYNENGNLVVQDNNSIQSVIDAAEPGDTIDVYPGTYEEVAEERDAYGTDNQPYSFGLYVGTDNLMIRGVTAEGEPITDANNVQAEIISTTSSPFGTNGPFISAEETTIRGLEITPNPDESPNKNIEASGDGLTLDSNVINGDIGSVYLNTGDIQSFSIVENQISAGVSFNDGVGNESAADNRIVKGNDIGLISFAGEDPDVEWRNHAVGTVTIENNTIRGHSYTLEYNDEEGNEQTYVYDGVVSSVGTVTQPTDFIKLLDKNTILRGSYIDNISEPTGVENIGTESAPAYQVAYSAQESVDAAEKDDKVIVTEGTYEEDITVNTENVSVVGVGDETVIDGQVTLNAEGSSVSDLRVTASEDFDTTDNEPVVFVQANDTSVERLQIDGITGDGANTTDVIQVFNTDDAPVSDVFIRNNTIEDIESDGVVGVSAIKVQGNLEEIFIFENEIDQIHSEGWAYGVVTTPSNAESDQKVSNVSVNHNSIENVTADEYAGVGVGIDTASGAPGTDGGLANETFVSANNIQNNDISLYNKDVENTLFAQYNYFGADAPTVEGDVIYDPFLTVEPDDLEADSPDELRNFGHDLVVPADGDVHSVAFPAPVEGTVDEVFGEFDGTVYAYDGDEWQSGADIADEEVGALDAFAVSVDDGEDDQRITFEYADGDSDVPSMTSAELDAGWNFVGAPEAGASEDAFAAATADVTTVVDVVGGADPQTVPYGLTASGQVTNPDRVSPFQGYWVFVTDDGELGATVPVDPTQSDEERALTGN